NMPDNAVGSLYFNDTALHIPEREGGKGYTIYDWQTAPDWQGATINEIEPVQFQEDVWLTGYGIDEGVVVLEWQLPASNPNLDYQWSVQPHDADGNKLGQADTQFWQGRHWCAGDRLLTWQRLNVVDTVASLQVFLYRLGGANEATYINAPVLDAMGNPA